MEICKSCFNIGLGKNSLAPHLRAFIRFVEEVFTDVTMVEIEVRESFSRISNANSLASEISIMAMLGTFVIHSSNPFT